MELALATMIDSRQDFYALRKPLVDEELQAIGWLRQEYPLVEAQEIGPGRSIQVFADQVRARGASALIVHLPIWADPVYTVRLANLIALPVLLMGNSRPETSSLVGILGAGGALDQIGRSHLRVFDHRSEDERSKVRAFARAATVLQRLRGQTLGLFGGRSLGITTTVADPAQWQRIFGVDIESIDQAEIVQTAEAIPLPEVKRHLDWLTGQVANVRYGESFTPQKLERQVRSYLATCHLVASYNLDFVGVKCQPELSDGYVTQCVAHTLSNGKLDADGEKAVLVHACEADADGALTMQILHLLSQGQSAALLDIRWYDTAKERWTLANCGAIPAAFFGGLEKARIEPHVFGQGGGGALPASVVPQPVTLARLCRRNGEYWMAILRGNVETASAEDEALITPAFPRAFVRTSAGADFLEIFGSNHIHMVAGDYCDELVSFCRLAGIRWQVWN
jgi:L-fucose isomerase